MCLFIHAMEELHTSRGHDHHGRVVTAFPDTQTVFVSFIYRHRAVANSFQHTLFKSPVEPN